jgi:hypothetical protein
VSIFLLSRIEQVAHSRLKPEAHTRAGPAINTCMCLNWQHDGALNAQGRVLYCRCWRGPLSPLTTKEYDVRS